MGGPKTPGNFVQDGPPKGGYPSINVKRNLPGGGMSTLAMAGSCVAMGAYGLYTVVMANRVRRFAMPTMPAALPGCASTWRSSMNLQRLQQRLN